MGAHCALHYCHYHCYYMLNGTTRISLYLDSDGYLSIKLEKIAEEEENWPLGHDDDECD